MALEGACDGIPDLAALMHSGVVHHHSAEERVFEDKKLSSPTTQAAVCVPSGAAMWIPAGTVPIMCSCPLAKDKGDGKPGPEKGGPAKVLWFPVLHDHVFAKLDHTAKKIIAKNVGGFIETNKTKVPWSEMAVKLEQLIATWTAN